MTEKFYHGDPNRGNHFWIYPTGKELVTHRWDAYDPSEICNNCTLIDEDSDTELKEYQCNGHDKAVGDGDRQAQIIKRRRG
ncbi:unnamed protein product [Rotaria sp. Silwood2]|nr:unnamed protein product [Rotaria sp. Silwood2]CAF4217454.1 unnamed protein product [Rotaria sp. Silwood2]